VEASHSALAPEKNPSGAADSATATRTAPADRRSAHKGFPRLTPEGGLQGPAGDEVRVRMSLQRRAKENLRHHIQRAAVRSAVLVSADFVAFYAMRGLLRLIRDRAVLGGGLARDLAALMPRGALTGWQFPLAMFLCLLVTGSYGQGDLRRSPLRLLVASALSVAVPLSWTEPARVLEYVLTTLLIWSGLTLERFTIDRLVALVRPPERDAPRTLLVGPSEQCRRAAATPVFASGRHFRTLGFLDADWPAATDALGRSSDLARLIHDAGADTVVICGHFEDDEFRAIVDTALTAGCELVSVPRTPDVAGVRPSFVYRDGELLVTLTAPVFKGQQLFVKRLADIVVSALVLTVASPLLLLIGVLVKLDSRGPALFSQERVGLGGRRFRIFKFRTMRADAEEQLEDIRAHSIYSDPRLFKVVGDPRVTRIGALLRRTSLDEVPQLWNVLKGDMALVGPRPPLPAEVALYEAHHYARFDVKPGITGPWQAGGRNEIRDFEEVVKLETAYIRDWSLWNDIKILLRTVPVVLKMRGAH